MGLSMALPSIIVSCTGVYGFLVVSHCGITVGNGQGAYTRYDGEFAGNPFWGQLIIRQNNYAGPYAPGTTVYYDDAASLSTVQCIKDVMGATSSGNFPYSFPFQNSNSAASWATNACGLMVPYPGNAVGTQEP
jgi:hypothetical protein